MTTFTTNPFRLQELLNQAKNGQIQLPDFQRSWVWNDEQIRSLLASVSLSYPIGTLMMLETGNPDVRFLSRLLEGVILEHSIKAGQLILDGQQRLTSLFLSLFLDKPVKTKDTKGKEVYRWYYIDIQKALDPNLDREEAIISLPEDRKLTGDFGRTILKDYSTSPKEYQAGVFPLSKIFNYTTWCREYTRLFQSDETRLDLFDQFEDKIIREFEQYQLPVITLNKNTPREAVCQVFEKVNTGGVVLTVFELITATFAANDFLLREDWERRKEKLQQYQLLEKIENTDFLQAVTLVATYKNTEFSVSCKRKDILNLSLDDYKKWANLVTQGFEKATQLLYKQKIFTARDLPYQTQLIALATIYAVLGDRVNRNDVREKLLRWYWCGVFGELYGSATETRLAKDLPQVIAWMKGNDEPATIKEANFAADRLLNLRTRTSAAYRGLYALVAQQGGYDFRTGLPIDLENYFDESIDIHHIFPRKWCQQNKIESGKCDCFINKTAITARTNRKIGGNAPSEYVRRLQTSEASMNEILNSHLIDPTAIRSDDFNTFFESRQNALLGLIEKAMGKSVLRQPES